MAEFCGVADNECLDPAGWGNMGGYYEASWDGRTGRTRIECAHCGTPCCANCRARVRGAWYCNYCTEATGD